jgi:hypothetical protein
LSGVRVGSAKLLVSAAGYDSYQEDLVVPSINLIKDVRLQRAERFIVGSSFAVYVPASVQVVTAVIVAFGGPDTRGFVTGVFNVNEGPPELAPQLASMAQSLQALATSKGIAILGTSLQGLSDSQTNDEVVLDALRGAAQVTGRPTIATAPLVMYGTSSGVPEAAGFAVRNSSRVAGLFIKVPGDVRALNTTSPIGFPVYALVVENDQVVNNAGTIQAIDDLRASNVPAALAVERNAVHQSLSATQRDLTISWMSAILQLRLSGNDASPLKTVDLTAGWLGNSQTKAISAWGDYSGDRAKANWFPTAATATEWQKFMQ